VSDNPRHPRSNIHRKLEAMAERGTHRGVDDVLNTAMHHAAATLDGVARQEIIMSDTLEPIEPTDTTEAGGAVPVIEMQPSRPRPSRRNRGIAGLGIAALLGIGGYASFALQGDGGGANSPTAAVEQLADAISNEDALAAVDVLAPDEVRSLKRSVNEAADKAEQFDIVEESADPFQGFDVDVNDLTTEVETLAEGYAKVTITGGVVDSAVDPAQLAPRFRDTEFGDAGSTSDQIDLAEVSGPADLGVFAIAVQDGDGWYVSPAYTALEYFRLTQEGAAAQLGTADAAQLGADSPEAAVRDAVEAIRTADWERMLELAPPSELPVWEYRDFIMQQLGETEPNFTVERLDLTTDVDGSAGFVTIDGAGAYGDDEGTWRIAADCPSDGLFGVARYDGTEGGAPPELCLSGSLGGLLFASSDDDVDARVGVVEEGGRWFVSPVGTALDMLDNWIGGVDEQTIALFTNDYSNIEPVGAITLGEPVTIASGFEPQIFTFEGSAGMEIVGQAGDDWSVSASIFGPDGEEVNAGYDLPYGYPVTLPDDGTYRIVLRGDVGLETTLTVWNVDDAPDGVVQDFGGEFNGGEFCYETSDGQVCESTVTTMPFSTDTTYSDEANTEMPTMTTVAVVGN
jgi:hypothetical protein